MPQGADAAETASKLTCVREKEIVQVCKENDKARIQTGEGLDKNAEKCGFFYF